MSEISITRRISFLTNSRRVEIQKLLKRIALRKNELPIIIKSSGRSLLVGASDDSNVGTDFRNWRFKTYVPGFNASFYEIWSPIDKDRYFLLKSYFHIYRTTSDLMEKEYLLLHCDPNGSLTEKHSLYRRGPHIHIKCAEHPIPRSHIALNAGHLNDTLSSPSKLNTAFKNAIDMIDTQVLELLK